MPLGKQQVVVDGSLGEGGGQVLRTSLTLAARLGLATTIENIRAGRPRPGLARQHLTAAHAVATVCGGRLEGAEVGSTRLAFTPGAPREGRFRFDVGTAGSAVLVAETLIPVAAAAPGPVEVEIVGGTDVPWAPSFDHFAEVHLPLSRRFGIRAEANCERRGFYPSGGGRVRLRVEPSELSPAGLLRGPVARIRGGIRISRLPDDVASRLHKAATRPLRDAGHDVHVEVERVDADDPGVVATLATDSGTTVLGSDALGEKGVRAEVVGSRVAIALLADLAAGVSVDLHAADQLMLLAALAGGSSYTAREATSHATTNSGVLARFLGERVRIEAAPGGLVTFRSTAGPPALRPAGS
ncbi:MAG: RNA 3'-terminal phosphate cyclase [Methanobacteriota archaeon]